MKKILISFFFIFLSCSFLLAQETSGAFSSKSSITIGTGINSNVGLLGLLYEYKLNNPVAFYAGAGVGTWGYKFSLGARYYFPGPLGTALGISFSNALGAKGIDVQTTVTENGVETTKPLTFYLNPVNVLNLSLMRYWKIGKKKKNKFDLELGYSFLLTDLTYTYSPSNYELADKSKSFINNLQPGGLLIATGFSFGL